MSQVARFFHDSRERRGSAPGDPIRHGSPVPRLRRQAARVVFVERSGSSVAMIGVHEIGEVRANEPGCRAAFVWRCFLPGCRMAPQPALSEAKAKGALSFTVAQWFEAASHPLPLARPSRIEGWRA